MENTLSYTYLIGWTQHNKWYYGVRYAKNCHPKDLWIRYFTSSKHVKKFREKYGEPDIIEIRKVFNDKNKAMLWEHKVLKRMKVTDRSDFLNKTDNKSIGPYVVSEEHKEKLRSVMTGKKNKKLSELNKLKIGIKNPFFGRKHSEEFIKNNLLGENNYMYGRTGDKHPNWGKKGPASGKKWYFNPITNECKYFIPGKQPTNFILGRKKGN